MTGASATWQAGATWAISTMTGSEYVEPADRPRRWDQSDDRELIRASAEGRREAFDEVVRRHSRTVYQICYRFVGNHEDASDLAQEVFLRAYRGAKGFKGEAAVTTWLYRIAVNAGLNRVAVRAPVFAPLDAAEPLHDRGERPDAALLSGERALAVRRAVAQLPGKQRATLVLRVYHDLSHREIAEILGGTIGAVKANFFHALRNLKRIMERGRL